MLAIYCRISGKKEAGTDVSIDVQAAQGKALADRLGLKHEVYKDEAVSGTLEIENRPAFANMIKDLEKKQISHLYCYDNSRLERNTEERFKILAILKLYDIEYYTESGKFDYSNPETNFFGNIESLFNSYFVATTKKKVKEALDKKVQRGEYRGGIYPYGYKVENKFLVINEKEADVVRKIFELSLSGMGQKSISIWLNENNVPTRYASIGKGTMTRKDKHTGIVTTTAKKDVKWADNTVRGILTNPIYKGKKKHRNSYVEAPALFSSDYWQSVQDNLKNNRNNSGKKVKHKYLLKGLLRCGRCGKNYHGRSKPKQHETVYVCTSRRYKGQSCGNRGINIPKLENFIWDRLFVHSEVVKLIEREYENTSNQNKLAALLVEVEKNNNLLLGLQNQKEKAIDLVLRGVVSEADLQSTLAKIHTKVDKVQETVTVQQKQIIQLKQSEKLIRSYFTKFEEYTHELSFSEKQRIIREIVKYIVVDSTENNYRLEIHFNITTPPKIYHSLLKETTFVGDGGYIYNPRWDEYIKELITKKKGDGENSGGGFNSPLPSTGNGNTPPPITNNNTSSTGPVTFNRITDVALVGGGAYPQPGEISLSHNGVLFLDELPEFKRSVLEVMRQPLEDREVTISRAKFTVTYPSSFMLVASMNPSPSGFFNDPGSPATSSPMEMQRYLSKISGPLLDRIDIHIEVTPVPFEKLSEERMGESSVEIRKRVTAARERQTKRFENNEHVHYNAQMNVRQIREFCALDAGSMQLLKTAMEKLNLSARAYDRILKVSRTIADLENSENITGTHISEAIQYRSLDREGWLG